MFARLSEQNAVRRARKLEEKKKKEAKLQAREEKVDKLVDSFLKMDFNSNSNSNSHSNSGSDPDIIKDIRNFLDVMQQSDSYESEQIIGLKKITLKEGKEICAEWLRLKELHGDNHSVIIRKLCELFL